MQAVRGCFFSPLLPSLLQLSNSHNSRKLQINDCTSTEGPLQFTNPLSAKEHTYNTVRACFLSSLLPSLPQLSVRKIFHESRKLQLLWSRDGEALAVQSVDLFLRSIGLREYSRYLSFNFPFTHERSLLANLKSFPWKIDEKAFKAWRQGRTG
jgi:hypothetical protein